METKQTIASLVCGASVLVCAMSQAPPSRNVPASAADAAVYKEAGGQQQKLDIYYPPIDTDVVAHLLISAAFFKVGRPRRRPQCPPDEPLARPVAGQGRRVSGRAGPA